MLDALAALAWVRDEIDALAVDLQPALPADAALCDYLRDGRALCLLTAALPDNNTTNNDDDNQSEPTTTALPKNLQRSLHQVSTFHALERVQYFIKWCSSTAALDAYAIFSSVQLLDERNDNVVCACLDALRTKYRPQLKASGGLWVKRSTSNLLESVASSNHSSRDDLNQRTHDAVVTDLQSAAAVVMPAPTSNNPKLNAFLSKFPSETNVLAPSASTATASSAAVATVEEQDTASDNDDNDDDDGDEPVELYDEHAIDDSEDDAAGTDADDEDDAPAATSERDAVARHVLPSFDGVAFSPRSSFSQSGSPRSSVSFSFTSDPRHHESIPDELLSQDQSFSSVLSSPPASPKAVTTRLRIPSIFERNVAENATTKDDATPRKLQIPSAFAATNAAVETPSALPTAAAGHTANGPLGMPAKPVSKLHIPAAFARSTSVTTASSTSSSSNASIERVSITNAKLAASTAEASLAKDAVSHTLDTSASAGASTPTKTPSKLHIPAAFARSGSTSSSTSATSDRSSMTQSKSERSTVAAVDVASIEASTAPVAAAIIAPPPPSSKTPSKLHIPAAFARSTSATTASSTNTTSERLSIDTSDAPSPASPVAPVLTRKRSKLKIPSAFAAGASLTPSTPSQQSADVDDVVASAEDVTAIDAHAAIDVLSSSLSTQAPAVAKSSLDAFIRSTSSSPPPPPSSFVEEAPANPPKASTVEAAPTTPKASDAARKVPTSPFAAFVTATSSASTPLSTRSVSDTAAVASNVPLAPPPSVTRSTSDASAAATAMPPLSMRRSTSSGSGAAPASRLAAFLSTVEVPNAFVAKQEDDSGHDSNDVQQLEAATRHTGFSDDELDASDAMGDTLNANVDAQSLQVSEEITFDDDNVVHVGADVQQDAVVGAQEEPAASSDVPAAAATAADVESFSSDELQSPSEHFDERLSDDSNASVDDAVAATFDERLSDESNDASVHDKRASGPLVADATAASNAATATTTTTTTTSANHDVDVEHHAIAHHDHADSEQPFFVVEEVSVAKPPPSSKLFAFLNTVDSAQTHRFSHHSTTSDEHSDEHNDDKPAAAVPTTAATNAVVDGSDRVVDTVLDANVLDARIDGTDAKAVESEPMSQTIATDAIEASGDDAVALENERLAAETRALLQQLATATDALAARDAALATLRVELEALTLQLADADKHVAAQSDAANNDFAAQLAAAQAMYCDERSLLERAHVAALTQQYDKLTTSHNTEIAKATEPLVAQVASLTQENASLTQENASLVQQLQQAQDSEAAARYAAQVAFAARDDAEERMQRSEH